MMARREHGMVNDAVYGGGKTHVESLENFEKSREAREIKY
jgi:hypothetical protein